MGMMDNFAYGGNNLGAYEIDAIHLSLILPLSYRSYQI